MHKMSCFIKGTLVGFAVGAAVGVMTDPLSDRERRKISKKTEGIFRNNRYFPLSTKRGYAKL